MPVANPLRGGKELEKVMKLGSLKQGRDGRLVVVSRDLAWCADAGHLAYLDQPDAVARAVLAHFA